MATQSLGKVTVVTRSKSSTAAGPLNTYHLVLSIAAFVAGLCISLTARAQILQSPWQNVFANNRFLGEIRSASELDCILGSFCDINYTLQTRAIDPAATTMDVRWHDASGGSPFDVSATMFLSGDTKTWNVSLPGSLGNGIGIKQQQGKIDFSSVRGILNTNATGGFWVPTVTPARVRTFWESVDELFEVSNSLSTNPTLGELISNVELLDSGEYRYRYTVNNVTGSVLSYDWPAAGLSGDLETGESISATVDSPLEPFLVFEPASLSYVSDEFGGGHLLAYSYPSAAVVPLAPIPEPTTLILSSAAAIILLGNIRRHA